MIVRLAFPILYGALAVSTALAQTAETPKPDPLVAKLVKHNLELAKSKEEEVRAKTLSGFVRKVWWKSEKLLDQANNWTCVTAAIAMRTTSVP